MTVNFQVRSLEVGDRIRLLDERRSYEQVVVVTMTPLFNTHDETASWDVTVAPEKNVLRNTERK